MKKLLLSSLFILLFSCSHSNKGELNLAKIDGVEGVIAKGYDVVSYFTQKKPVKGKQKYSYSHGGANWFFSSQKNLDLFMKNPEKYAPQYGGYCAFAVAVPNKKVDIDPKSWYVKNNKLYLNYSKPTQKIWLQNLDENIIQGDENWKTLKNK